MWRVGFEPSCSYVLGTQQVLGTVPKGRWFTNSISSRCVPQCVAEEKHEVRSHNYLINYSSLGPTAELFVTFTS